MGELTPNQRTAFDLLEQAQVALKNGDKLAARQLAAQAAGLAPELEEVWLMMAALAQPRASLEYLRRALQINPASLRAQQGLARAEENLRKEPAEKAPPCPVPARAQKARRRENLTLAVLLLGLFLVCLIAGTILVSAVTPVSAFFSLVPGASAAGQGRVSTSTTAPGVPPTEPAAFTPAPTETLLSTPSVTASPTLTAAPSLTATASQTPSPAPTFAPSETPTEAASPTPLPTDTPEPTLAPLPTRPPVQAPASGNSSTSTTGGAHWIEVDLTHQMVYAYEGQTLVNSFVVSTGAAPRLTVTGSYHVYERHLKGNMWGPGYFLPDVPYIMYFYKGFALHGTYWHSNFGTPMSHGCVNLSIPDAEWLYSWSTLGTLVKVHY
jgi:lipoprotein-anchoring transpeptidase ErfK/SrfK